MTLLELFSLAEAWASAAGAEHHAPSIHQLWFPLINFLIFVYLIKRFAVPLIQDYLRSRREGILAAVTVRDYRERLVRLSQEVKQIEDSLKDEGAREKTKLLDEAQGLAAKIKEDARFLAEQEVKIARQKIREEMADRARASAAELVRRNLSSADQGRLVEEFVRGIGQTR